VRDRLAAEGGPQRICSTGSAFAALMADGSVVTWGFGNAGGDSSGVQEQLQGDVQAVYATEYAFAAAKRNGTVVTWGYANSGGNSSKVREQLDNLQGRLN